MLAVPIGVGILGIVKFQAARMGRTYYDYDGFRIYEVGFPVGSDAAFFCLIDEDRHYFRTLTQAKLYLDQRRSQLSG